MGSEASTVPRLGARGRSISQARRGEYGSSRFASPSRRDARRRILTRPPGGRSAAPSRASPHATRRPRERGARLRLGGARVSGVAAGSWRRALSPCAPGRAAVGAGRQPRPLLRSATPRCARGSRSRLYVWAARASPPRRPTARARTPGGRGDCGVGRDRGLRRGLPRGVRLHHRDRRPGVALDDTARAAPRGCPTLRRASRPVRRSRDRGQRVRACTAGRGNPAALHRAATSTGARFAGTLTRATLGCRFRKSTGP